MVKVSECTKRPVLSPCRLKDLHYQVDPYIGCEHCCHYCYAVAQAETDWSEEIRIHQDIVGQLAAEMNGLTPQAIYMGYHTDPYQPCEAEYLQTRKVLELFHRRGFSASILTKSDLVLRDIDILEKMDDAGVSISVAFNDDQTRRLFEANTMETDRRIAVLRRLKAAGVKTGALVCPIIPYITDAARLIEQLQSYTDVIWIYGLSIENRSGQIWLKMNEILNLHYPELVGRIKSAIFSRDDPFWTQLREQLETIREKRQLNLNIHV